MAESIPYGICGGVQNCLSAQDQHADPQRNAEISSNVTQVFKIKPQASSIQSPTQSKLCERLCETVATELDLPGLF